MKTVMQNHLKFYQKLHSILSDIEHLNGNDKNGNFDIELTSIFYKKGYPFWFSKGENKNKIYYFFGTSSKTLNNVVLTIDFDSSKEYSKESLGSLVAKDNDVNLLLNRDILKERYPHINPDKFPLKTHDSTDYVDLGYLKGDLIKNLQKIIKQADIDLCEICNSDIAATRIDSRLKSLKRIKPHLCGKCIEKIVTCEFFKKSEHLIDNGETKLLQVAREKFGNDELFDFGLKLFEKYSIIKYIGFKKSFFTIEKKNNEVILQYMKYVDEDEYLLDTIFKNDNVSFKDTTVGMNLFINALNAGKSHKVAYKIARITPEDVNIWYKLGRNGNPLYKDFYKKYKKFKTEFEGMERFLRVSTKYKNFKKAIKDSDLKESKVNKWFELGFKGDEDYEDFYKKSIEIYPRGFNPESDEKLMKNFINLRKLGKSKEEAIDELKIPESKVQFWIKQAEAGDAFFKDFFNAYTKKVPRRCSICGRRLPNRNMKICKRCKKSQFASKILIKILDYIEPGKIFKKDDLLLMNLQPIQIKEYLWTLKEFNLISEKNNKYRLKPRKDLEIFVKSAGMDVGELPKQTKQNLYKTCEKCGKSLKIDNFQNGSNVCRDCKKEETTVKYLKEIMEHVDFGEEFSEDDLSNHFKNPFKLKAKLWALADHDLVKKNFNDDSYVFASRDRVNDFLTKNGEELIADEEETLFNQVQNVVFRLKDDKFISLDSETFSEWLDKGKKGIKPYNEIYDAYNEIKKNNPYKLIPDLYPNFKTTAEKMNNVILNLTNGDDLNEALEKADVNLIEYENWIEDGKNKTDDIFSDFYDIIGNVTDKQASPSKDDGILTLIPQDIEEKLKRRSKGSNTGFAWVNKGGNYYKYSRTVNKKPVMIKDKNIHQLYKKVKKEGYLWGVRNLTKAKACIGEAGPDIYDPLPEKYLDTFPRKSNLTGIAWVNKVGNFFVYSRKIDGKTVQYRDKDIRELFKRVINNDHIWGIRDYEKASRFIDGGKDTKKEGILTQLPEKYSNSFSLKSNATGIAWVNKSGKRYVYTRTVKGKTIRYSDEDIYKLYDKVTADNQIWGIKDLNKASKIINASKTEIHASSKTVDAGEAEEIPPASKTVDVGEAEEIPPASKTVDVGEAEEDEISIIYELLPQEYKKYAEDTNTGIAWVNQKGNRWIYNLKIDEKIIRLTSDDIHKLHEKVLDNNGIWGVIDIDKARKTINPDSLRKNPKKIGNVSVNYIDKSKTKSDVIIKGNIRNNQLYLVLNKLKDYELDFKRILTTSVSNRLDIFVELEIYKNSKNIFEDKIKSMGWKINR